MRAFLVALLVLFSASHALAEETIRRFISEVTINADASLDVRETIVVNAEGRQIKRGIIRDFPTDYKDGNGSRLRVGFDLVAVERDGRPEPYSTSYNNNGVSIKIGDADVFLDRGEHTYLITYRTTRQLGFFESYDELYWNATGHGWTFPIEQAEAIIILPDGAQVSQPSIYTGPFGSKSSDARIIGQGSNRLRAVTTRRLELSEGLSVAVAWQKGIVAAPTAADQRLWWISDNMGFFVAGLTLLASLLYYFFAWNRVGRDPPTGTIVPLFHPPANLGPAATRFIWRQKFDDQAFAAAIVGLAVKNRVKISDTSGTYSVSKTGGTGPALTNSEQTLLDRLPSGRLELEQSNHTAVGGARDHLRDSLEEEFTGAMFLRNMGWFSGGAAISILGMLLAGLLTPAGEGTLIWFVTLFSSIWWAIVLSVAWAAVKGFRVARGFLGKLGSLFGMVFLLPFIAGGVAVPSFVVMSTGTSPAMLIFIACAVGLALANLLFYHLLKAPTEKGRRVMDQIEGFRMYMTTAEEERLKVLHPPEKTPELFERYLPYAMALDCENEWNAKFVSVLAAAAAAGAAASPGWYSGHGWNSRGFASDLNNGLSSAISSSSTAPGSSSGSGGGGFSGGGGGGGGGSGW